MKIKWEYNLPTEEYIYNFNYVSPIYIKENQIFFISFFKQQVKFHIIDDKTGVGSIKEIKSKKITIPSNYFIFEYQNKIIFYFGELFLYEDNNITSFIHDDTNVGEIYSYILNDNQFIFISSESILYCYNLDTLSLEWKVDIKNTKKYNSKELVIFENTVACYGNDSLLFIDINTGKINNQIKISRIDKLYHPLKLDDDNIVMGYTNWTNAGVLKYNLNTKQIIWKHKRSFSGPQLNCKLYQYDDNVYWVKNDTELICLNILDGKEVFSVRTNPWLYTNLYFIQDYLIFGTSGRDGYLYNINPKSGFINWTIFINNGCTYFDTYQDTIIVGDFSKSIKQIKIDNGKIISNLDVDGEVIGRIKVNQNNVYTVIWINEMKPIRLIKIEI